MNPIRIPEKKILPKWRGYKEGILSKTIMSIGGSTHLKGSIVRYRRHKVLEFDTGIWTGEYEWHYLDQTNHNLIRIAELYIEQK